jgi:Outer membrane protein beta-barrel domain
MKKAILLSMMSVAALFTIVTGAKAQKGFYAGAQGGTRLTVMFNKTDADKPGAEYKSKAAYAYGVNAGYNFSRHMGIGTEVTYSKTKQRYSDNGVSFKQNFNYLKIPVLFTYNTNSDRKFIFTAKAGPQLGMLHKATISEASNSDLNGNAKEQYKKFTFGAMAGAGVRVKLVDKIYLDAGIHVDGTISNIENKDNKFNTAGRSKTHDLNGGLEVGIRYFF